MNVIFGWINFVMYGLVIFYNVYWIVVISGFLVFRYCEVKGCGVFVKSGKCGVGEFNVNSFELMECDVGIFEKIVVIIVGGEVCREFL